MKEQIKQLLLQNIYEHIKAEPQDVPDMIEALTMGIQDFAKKSAK